MGSVSSGVEIKVHFISVARLSRFYAPDSILEAFELPTNMEWVESTTPLKSYRGKHRGPKYHSRRIRYFVDQLRAGRELEPVEVRNESCVVQRYFPYVTDGHHRMLAYVYEKRRTMPCIYVGRPDLLDYLTYERTSLPR